MRDLYREICKPILKLVFTVHGLMKSLSEFGHCKTHFVLEDLHLTRCLQFTHLLKQGIHC
jgi:hypothetical protein